jgi:hypothetical protein
VFHRVAPYTHRHCLRCHHSRRRRRSHPSLRSHRFRLRLPALRPHLVPRRPYRPSRPSRHSRHHRCSHLLRPCSRRLPHCHRPATHRFPRSSLRRSYPRSLRLPKRHRMRVRTRRTDRTPRTLRTRTRAIRVGQDTWSPHSTPCNPRRSNGTERSGARPQYSRNEHQPRVDGSKSLYLFDHDGRLRQHAINANGAIGAVQTNWASPQLDHKNVFDAFSLGEVARDDHR